MKITHLTKSYSDCDIYDILLIIEQVTGIRYSRLLAMDEVDFTTSQQKLLEAMVKRLKSGEPIQYILGTWDFIDLELKVDSRALIPRPETELLTQQVVKYAKQINNPKIVDLGCGTGCIGLYAKSILPHADVTLIDISKDAISLASENAEKLELDVHLIHQDMADLEGKYHIIVSNPPYISSNIVKSLDISVKDYEPLTALDGGDDGLDFYRMLTDMNDNLFDDGSLMLEIGYDQGLSVSKLMEEKFTDINIIKDISGNDRIIIARK